jgi:hypothetical protein
VVNFGYLPGILTTYILTQSVSQKVHVVTKNHQESAIQRLLPVTCQLVNTPVKGQSDGGRQEEGENNRVSQVADFIPGEAGCLEC